MEIGRKFDDIASYNSSMSKAMQDKLFFVDKLPKNKSYVFVDFGCADGTMINNLVEIFGDSSIYIGYDKSQTMICLAKERFQEVSNNVIFTSKWEEVIDNLCFASSLPSVLILSSVIHEVYSYSSQEEVKEFWKRVKGSCFNYIVIRDMMPRNSMNASDNYYRCAIEKITHINGWIEKAFNDFTKIWGPITTIKDSVHFLLKYRWKTNWEREVHENYFPITLEEVLEIIKEPPYQMVYFENFKIPFICNKIEEDFRITLKDNTHVKLIFKLV